MKNTFYDALGVSRSATPEAIEAAYRNLVQKCQASGSLESQNQLNMGRYAYEILSKPEERIQYDKKIAAENQIGSLGRDKFLDNRSNSGDALAPSWRTLVSWRALVAIALLIGFGFYFSGSSERKSFAKFESTDAPQIQVHTLNTAPTTKENNGDPKLNQSAAESKEEFSAESVGPRSIDDGSDARYLAKPIPTASNIAGEAKIESPGRNSDVELIQQLKANEVASQQQEIQRLQVQQLEQQKIQLQAAQKQLELQRLQQEEVRQQLAATRKEQDRQRLQQEEIHFQLQIQALRQPQSQQIIGPQLQQQVTQPQGQPPQSQVQSQAIQSQGAQTQQQLQTLQQQAQQQLQTRRQQLRQDCLAGLPSQASMSKEMQRAGTSSHSMGAIIAQRRALCDSMQ